ncbi:MAG: epoxide hydrolase N-terminal domain-containing protein, partial [Acidimicrobiaceae bacterium]|nr:epoxide hydrolase N-terminal domain-containing protein [Acidimicrobiaceae bacterium]
MAPVTVERFQPVLDRASLGLLNERLDSARLLLHDGDDWERGTPSSWLGPLLEDWRASRASLFQAQLDRLTHVRVRIDGTEIHAVHQVG